MTPAQLALLLEIAEILRAAVRPDTAANLERLMGMAAAEALAAEGSRG